jgi:hypothetical protein
MMNPKIHSPNGKRISIRMKSVLSIGFFVVTFFILMNSLAFGQFDDKRSRFSLRGLQGVGVIIGNLSLEANKHGLTKIQLLTDIEQRLRKAEIQVLSQNDLMDLPRMPILYANVDIAKHSTGPNSSYTVRLELRQALMLSRDHTIKVMGTTWGVASVGILPGMGHRTIREVLANLVDKFIITYHEMNP